MGLEQKQTRRLMGHKHLASSGWGNGQQNMCIVSSSAHAYFSALMSISKKICQWSLFQRKEKRTLLKSILHSKQLCTSRAILLNQLTQDQKGSPSALYGSRNQNSNVIFYYSQNEKQNINLTSQKSEQNLILSQNTSTRQIFEELKGRPNTRLPQWLHIIELAS